MKKLFPFILIMLLLAGCSSADEEALDALYEAFDRNHDELEQDFETSYNEIEETDDRETQLKILYDELLPRIDDFRTTIENHTVSKDAHTSLKENMLSYIDGLKELTEMNGEFNRVFLISNPLGDENFTDEAASMVEEIEAKEKEVQDSYENIVAEYENLALEQ